MSKVFLVAEIGCNHNGDFELARRMVKEAHACGVDGVKFQTFSADALISKYAPKAEYQKKTTGEQTSQLEMTRALELPQEQYLELKAYAESLGLITFSTAFDLGSINFLAEQGQTIWKIPSGEITNLPYLEAIAALHTPEIKIILSTGMANIDEISACLEIITSGGILPQQIIILHCNTEYPTPDVDVNVSAMKEIHETFPEYAYGFSDHSVGYVAAVGAVALGAAMVEKHFTLDKNLPGPDHKASATPEELKALVENVRRMEVMLGDGHKKVTDSEAKNKIVARKSIVAAKPIKQGDIFTEENITCKRPGSGISPMKWYELLGKTAERDFDFDELIEATDFEWQIK